MQAMTHIAIGALGAACYHKFVKAGDLPREESSLQNPFVKGGFLIVVLSLLIVSHVILDDLALATYHPSEALVDNLFWLVFHAFVALFSLYLLVHHRLSWLFILAALTPDLDWLARMVNLWEEGAAHEFFRTLPVVDDLSGVLRSNIPDWRMLPFAATIELGLLAAFLVLEKLIRFSQRQN